MLEKTAFVHKSVLLQESIQALEIKENGIYVDCTAGGAGHSLEIASKLSKKGLLIAIDQDQEAIAEVEKKLKKASCQVMLFKENFVYLDKVLDAIGIKEVDGILFDLGVSSYQLEKAERGFSYKLDASLDMRMDTGNLLTADKIVNEYSKDELSKIIWQYGEERFAKRIAGNIVKTRERKRISTTLELAEIVKNSIPAAKRRTGHHPAKKTFQAIRIVVNSELEVLKDALLIGSNYLAEGGKMAVITFHSLEDRIVKQFFKEVSLVCKCPKDMPFCICGGKENFKVKKSIKTTEKELLENSRARSARLRVLTKILQGKKEGGK